MKFLYTKIRMRRKPPIQSNGMIGLAAWAGQSLGMFSAHQHLDLEINFVISGTVRYLIGGQLVELPPGRMCLLWGGVVHQMMRNREPVEMIWVTVPLAVVLRWGLPDYFVRPLLATGIVVDPTPLPRDQDTLRQWISDLGGGSDDLPVRRSSNTVLDEIVLLEIETRLRRCALGLSGEANAVTVSPQDSQADSTAHSDRGLTAVETMAQFMSQNFQNEIEVADVAKPAHLHPNYAMVIFRQHTGMTISQYLTLQRVAHAQRLLATTDDPITDIAFRSGFRSVSRFYEAFRQQTKNSPRRFRLHISPKHRLHFTE